MTNNNLETVAAFLRHFWMEHFKTFLEMATIDPPGTRASHTPMSVTFGPECTIDIMKACNQFWSILGSDEQDYYRQEAKRLLAELNQK